MEPIKNIYNKNSISMMSDHIKRAHPSFKKDLFVKKAIKKINSLEMKERVVQISACLKEELSGDYKNDLHLLLKTIKSKNNPNGLSGFILWPYTQFIETYGLKHYSESMRGLYKITKVFTSEFGVRPFFEEHPERTYKLFHKYSEDKNEHVRRWVSEGTRPNLPWGKNISHLKAKSSLAKNIEILEKLKNDPSEYVRKSVANHLNDITWLDEKLALKTIKKWIKQKTPPDQKLVKMALRNLLKKGNPEALNILGFDPESKVTVENVKLSKNSIYEGEDIELEFKVKNLEENRKKLMIDYKIHYPKKNKKVSVKTFKFKSISLNSKETAFLRKKISFKKVSTRTHYSGAHKIQLQINGKIKDHKTFNLNKVEN